MRGIFYFSVLVILNYFFLFAQETGGDSETIPPYIRLREIKTEHFNVIYPKAFSPYSKKFSEFLEETYEKIRVLFPDSIIDEKSRWPIFINTFNITANGYVNYSSKHSQFYGSISPEAPEIWLEKLALHELVHIFQNELGKKHFLKALLYIFGQEGYSLLINSAIGNNWLWEGQAVASESIFSNYGRGNDPRFDMELKALLLEDDLKKFPDYYNHLANSSWKLYPNYYVYGYFLTLYLKERYGDDIWTKLFTESSNFPIFSFYVGVRKITGKDINDIYKEMLKDLKEKYTKQVENLKLSAERFLTRSPKLGRTDYLYPKPLPNGDVLALRSQYRDFLRRSSSVKQLIKINPEGKITYLGEVKADKTSKIQLGSNLVVWSALESSLRWRSETYRNIYTYNLKTRLKKKISQNGRFFSVAISPDDTTIAGVFLDHSNKASIRLIDAKTGKTLKSFFEDQNEFYFDLHFNNNRDLIYVRTLSKTEENQVETLDIDTGKVSVFFRNKDINANPIADGRYVFYESSYSGIQNIYAYDVEEKVHFQVTSSRLGSFSPASSFNGKTLFFSSYANSHGYNIAYLDVNKEEWTPKNETPINKLNYYEGLQIKDQKKLDAINLKKEEIRSTLEKTYVEKEHWKASTFNFRGFSFLPSGDFKNWKANFHFQDIYKLFDWNVFSSLKTKNPFAEAIGYDVGTSIATSFPYVNFSGSLTYSNTSYQLKKNEPNLKHESVLALFGLNLPLYFYFDDLTYVVNPSASYGVSFHRFNRKLRIAANGVVDTNLIQNYNLTFFEQRYSISQYFLLTNYQLTVGPLYKQIIGRSMQSFQIQFENAFAGFYGIDVLHFDIFYGFSNSSFFLPLNSWTTGYDEELILNKIALNVSYDIPILTRGHLGPILNFEDLTLTPFYQETFVLSRNIPTSKNLKSLGFDFLLHFKILNSVSTLLGLRYAYSFDKIDSRNFIAPIWSISGLF